MVLKPQLKQNKQRLKIMRKIIASEFMAIDGVMQNEEADKIVYKTGQKLIAQYLLKAGKR
jgi:hypothetical protein